MRPTAAGDGVLSRDTFSYTVQARCSPSEAAALLSDLTRQGELHPLIVRVRRVSPRPGALASYTINDRLQAGPFRFRTTYHADVLLSEADEIVMVARQWPATTVRNHTRLRAEPDGLTRIDVEITLTAPTPSSGTRSARPGPLTSPWPPGWARPWTAAATPTPA
ncbi:SRPBCC family protein [Micromonospora sp. M12]